MKRCDSCGSRILFGGVHDGFHHYCGENCRWAPKLASLPKAEVDARVREVHQGACPKCARVGPVDVHTSHWVYSALAFTRWGSRPELCCRSCARWNYVKDGMFSLVCGWWGFPFGLMLTPAQLIRNFGGLTGMSGPKLDEPSPDLRRIVGLTMAQERYVAGKPEAQA